MDSKQPPALNAIVVLALGTRGDVQPLAILAASGLATAFPATTPIFFVSHAEHESFLRRLWGHPTPPSNFTFVPSPSPAHAPPAAASAPTANLEESLRPREHLQVCLDVVRRAISLSSSAIIVANLFALEAVHLAEAFNLPLIMAHPYPMPSSMPAAFPQQFRRMDPRQYKALRQAQHAQVGQTRLLSWKDVEHWLWPAFASSWVNFRRMLGLPEEDLPYLAGRLAPPLLYLYDELILPRPHYYADHVHVVGYLFSPEQNEEEEEEEPYSKLAHFLAAAEPHAPGPIFITFGSMISLSALGNLEHAADTVVKAMIELNKDNTSSSPCLRFIVDCGGGGGEGPAWTAAMRKAIEKKNEKDGAMLFILKEGISHSWLLPKCTVIVHHGGSGTSAASLRAGIAQITVPMMLDQHMWATQLAWLDVGPPPLSLEALFPSSDEELLSLSEPPSQLLATAIRQASHPSTRLRAAALGRRLRAVGGSSAGLARCLDLIQAHLEEWSSGSSLPMGRPPALPLPDGCELLVLSTMEETIERGEGEGEGEGDGEESSTLTVAALKGSESEVAFIHHEIFPPHASQHGNWGYLKHGITLAKEGRKGGDAPAPAVVILDVGANIGLFGLYLDMYAQEEDEEESELLVVAIEPAPRTFAALQYNLASHGVKHIAVQKAVVGGGEEGVERKGLLRFYPHMPGNSALVGKEDPGQEKLLPQGINPRLRTHLQEGMEEMEVELTTISALLREHGLKSVDLLKVDVEGQEEAVLQGIREEDWPSIAQVVMEVHTGVEGTKERIDFLLKTKGEFTSVVWEVPGWAKDNDQMDNAMVYATRSRRKDKDQASETEAEWEKEEG